MPLFLPPLRERRDDIRPLVHHFITKMREEHGNRIQGIGQQALDALEAFAWPGNIRELENAIEHSFILENSDHITYFSLPEYIRRAHRKPIVPDAPIENGATATPRIGFDDMDWEGERNL